MEKEVVRVRQGLYFFHLYHLSKANTMADVLSYKSERVVACMMIREWRLMEDVIAMELEVSVKQEVV